MEPSATATEALEYQAEDIQIRCIHEKENTETPRVEYYSLESTADQKEPHTEQIIPVPADGLCMYYCVHAARDINWMKNRHASGTSPDKYNEKEDAAQAQALRREFITFFVEKGNVEVPQRLAIPGSEGYPSTDEMPFLVEMLQGRIEMGDF